jgi:Ni2+-binding GTPase involved in maturation of urease and hydrogenase
MLGGFLGAGKTTSLGRLARMYQDEGHRVAIVTNDQAADLVDTATLRAQGHRVGEVAGACFCCQFDELTDVVGRLAAEERPDIVLAEPVGSCTDLVATVIQPLRQLYTDGFTVAPYAVVVKPAHARRILRGESSSGGFSPKAEYIFRKQLEEADLLLVNRIDELEPAEAEDLVARLHEACPGVPVLSVSAKSGEGFDSLVEWLGQDGLFGQRILDIDYDIYAEGEAELGWLNANVTFRGDEAWDVDATVLGLVDSLATRLAAVPAETAHLKIIALTDESFAVANLIASDQPSVLSLASQAQAKTAQLVINARVAIDPESLERIVRETTTELAAQAGLASEWGTVQSLQPGRPVPVHRFDTAK